MSKYQLNSLTDVPWDNGGCGALVSVDGTSTERGAVLKRADVAELLAYGETAHDDWDGKSAGIARLVDGRFIAWESWWGPTGSGFHCDAYGGDADILFGASVQALMPHLTESARELLVFAGAR